jgi:CsoR family transcriptional regulator, copper-sensing transcriptional repressor
LILSAFYGKFGIVQEENKEAILRRLARIEGQIRGLSRMVNSEVSCDEIAVQVQAVRSAINRVGFMILEKKLDECLLSGKTDEKKIESLHKLLVKLAGS